MSNEEDQKHLDQRRVRRVEAAIATGDEQAVQRAGGAGTEEAKEARRRVTVRRMAKEGREKRAEQIKADAEQRKAQQAGTATQTGHRPATGADRRQNKTQQADRVRSATMEQKVQEVKDMNKRAAVSRREEAARKQKAGQGQRM